MAKKIKFPLEMRDGVQARTLEELQEYFDIEKAMRYLVDGKLCTWLEDRYYMSEAETIKGIDAYASDAKEKLCSALGVELEVDAEVDVEEIERRKERLAKLKQYTDDELIWEKVDQVAFNQEDLADLLDEDCKEIFLCSGKFQIPYAVGNVIYRGIGDVSIYINATGGEIDLEKKAISYENVKILNENITDMDSLEKSIIKRTKQIIKYESKLECEQEIKLLAIDFVKYSKKNSQNRNKCFCHYIDIACLLVEILGYEDWENIIDSEDCKYIEQLAEQVTDYEGNQQFDEIFSELESISDQRYYGRRDADSLDAGAFIAELKKLNKYLKDAIDNQEVEELVITLYNELTGSWDCYAMIYITCYDFWLNNDIQRNVFEVSIEFLKLLTKFIEIVGQSYPCFYGDFCGRNLPYDKSSKLECDMKYLMGDLMYRCGRLAQSSADEASGQKMMVEAVRERVKIYGNSSGRLKDYDSCIIVEGYNKDTGSYCPGAAYRHYCGCIMGVYQTQTGRIYYIENKAEATRDTLYWIEPDGTLGYVVLQWQRANFHIYAFRYLFEVREYSSYDEIFATDEIYEKGVWEDALTNSLTNAKWITINH